jgi:nucleotide-binding universal stress UspA family protein
MERGGLRLKWYLQEIAQHLAIRRVETDHAVVESGNVPEKILAQTKEYNCDLMAMSTHGRSGLGRGLLGSVTDAVIRSSDIPVLAVGPRVFGQHQEEELSLKRVIVPLDGSPLAEEVLPWVRELAGRLFLEVRLIRVVTIPTWPYSGDDGPPLDTTAIEEELESEAAQYLETIGHRLQKNGVKTECTVLRGTPEAKIIEFSQGVEESMMALSTHGRSGLGRVLIGSVADKVIRSLEVPVMVVRPKR